jgi:ubiquinol-cytochrome c reductase iron-sulfur subunit
MNDEQDQRAKRLRRMASVLAALLTARALREAFARRREAPPARGGGPGAEEDPSRREVPGNRRAEILVAILLVGAALFAFGFTVVYVAAEANTQLLGLALGGALALLAAGAIIAGKAVVPQETSVEQRDVLLNEPEVAKVLEIVESGGEGISRRTLLAGAAGLAGAGVLTAAVTPLASLGPDLDGIHQTPWRRGVRLVDDQGRPYSAEEIQIGAFYTALPEHGAPSAFGSGLLVVKLPAHLIHLPPARSSWAPEGILAYSKICPHAGCAISLYRYPTYQPTSVGPAFTCPCHYSTFSPGEGGRLMFGPAGRALPQLPVMIDSEGNLRAAGGFHEDIGPSWWSVHRGQS